VPLFATISNRIGGCRSFARPKPDAGRVSERVTGHLPPAHLSITRSRLRSYLHQSYRCCSSLPMAWERVFNGRKSNCVILCKRLVNPHLTAGAK
jgi:hypothetical protein